MQVKVPYGRRGRARIGGFVDETEWEATCALFATGEVVFRSEIKRDQRLVSHV